jgi:hypothetical protein
MIQDVFDHGGGKRKVSICGRNIDSDPTGETGIEFSSGLPSPRQKVWDSGVGLFLKWITKSDKIPHFSPHL